MVWSHILLTKLKLGLGWNEKAQPVLWWFIAKSQIPVIVCSAHDGAIVSVFVAFPAHHSITLVLFSSNKQPYFYAFAPTLSSTALTNIVTLNALDSPFLSLWIMEALLVSSKTPPSLFPLFFFNIFFLYNTFLILFFKDNRLIFPVSFLPQSSPSLCTCDWRIIQCKISKRGSRLWFMLAASVCAQKFSILLRILLTTVHRTKRSRLQLLQINARSAHNPSCFEAVIRVRGWSIQKKNI